MNIIKKNVNKNPPYIAYLIVRSRSPAQTTRSIIVESRLSSFNLTLQLPPLFNSTVASFYLLPFQFESHFLLVFLPETN
ncbi:hypothetical protein ACN38_g3741 [Penicillium nordicum]|uniref:Uncharacterized protein n=1 Tax=Penicillium nordicum TaxID=229535 RepID=A0A0M9WHR8_9EURO|nr:hypothetical protein ACN38_g3741 [Penicillium nordicum]